MSETETIENVVSGALGAATEHKWDLCAYYLEVARSLARGYAAQQEQELAENQK